MVTIVKICLRDFIEIYAGHKLTHENVKAEIEKRN